MWCSVWGVEWGQCHCTTHLHNFSLSLSLSYWIRYNLSNTQLIPEINLCLHYKSANSMAMLAAHTLYCGVWCIFHCGGGVTEWGWEIIMALRDCLVKPPKTACNEQTVRNWGTSVYKNKIEIAPLQPAILQLFGAYCHVCRAPASAHIDSTAVATAHSLVNTYWDCSFKTPPLWLLTFMLLSLETNILVVHYLLIRPIFHQIKQFRGYIRS